MSFCEYYLLILKTQLTIKVIINSFNLHKFFILPKNTRPLNVSKRLMICLTPHHNILSIK